MSHTVNSWCPPTTSCFASGVKASALTIVGNGYALGGGGGFRLIGCCWAEAVCAANSRKYTTAATAAHSTQTQNRRRGMGGTLSEVRWGRIVEVYQGRRGGGSVKAPPSRRRGLASPLTCRR